MTERIRVSLQSFQVPLSWYQILDGRNTISVTNLSSNTVTNLTVPPGTYSYHELCRVLQTLYAPLSAKHFPNQNTLLLFTLQPHRYVFSKGLAEIMGFLPGVPYEGTSVHSPLVCQPLTTQSIHIRLANMPPAQDNLSMTNLSGDVDVDATLAIVPVVNTQPFHVLTWENDIDTGVFTGDHKLTQIEFLLSNEDGDELTFLPDHVMVLKIETHEQDDSNPREMMRLLRGLKEAVDTLVLYKHVRP